MTATDHSDSLVTTVHDPAAGLVLSRATRDDVDELLVLQRCCWVAEAIACQSLEIPALHEDHRQVEEGVATWHTWVLRNGPRLVGSVRARQDDTDWEIGRLMVAPDLAGRGWGRWLLAFAEAQAHPTVERFRLVTGARSERNIAIYNQAGYQLGDREGIGVWLSKPHPTQ